MDIKLLTECGLVKGIELVGQTVEFKTPMYSAGTSEIGEATISCPLSGNYLLTESAKVITGDVDPSVASKMLEKLFFSMQEWGAARDAGTQNVAGAALEVATKRAAARFLEVASSDPDTDMVDIESLRFAFLKQCSSSFQHAYERSIKN